MMGENTAKVKVGLNVEMSLGFTHANDRICWMDLSHMAKLRIIFESGEPERVMEFNPADAPFHHDGRPGSILDIMLGHKIHLEHACGGNCACTTCHVIVKGGMKSLSESEESEEDMLDRAPGLTPTSRLGCQAVITDPNAEVTIVVPRFTVNLVSESRSED